MVIGAAFLRSHDIVVGMKKKHFLYIFPLLKKKKVFVDTKKIDFFIEKESRENNILN